MQQENKSQVSFEELMKDFQQFSIDTFPKATALTSLKKLDEEMKEVAHELIHGHKDLVTEYTDCIMCLLSSMARVGITADQFKDAFARKLKVNKERKWKHNGDGTYSHIKDGPLAPALNQIYSQIKKHR